MHLNVKTCVISHRWCIRGKEKTG